VTVPKWIDAAPLLQLLSLIVYKDYHRQTIMGVSQSSQVRIIPEPLTAAGRGLYRT
jgi:hypothetical protein